MEQPFWGDWGTVTTLGCVEFPGALLCQGAGDFAAVKPQCLKPIRSPGIMETSKPLKNIS